LLDVLCGITDRTNGNIIYEGDPIDSYRMKNLSFCLQKNYLWEYLTFEEHIRIVGEWRGLDPETITQLLSEIDSGLDVGKNMRINALHLSGGNQRKLNTILALLSAPKIFILDEPTAGMDPKSRR
jgi:ABC-type multidrug transport system ATPase subunit